MKYRIGSFNVRNLNRNSNRDFDWIAEIINKSSVDIVALQEVLSEGNVLIGSNILRSPSAACNSIINKLGKNWKACWRYPDPNQDAKTYIYNDTRGEGYAFLWNEDRVELLRDKGSTVEPAIWKNYHTNKSSLDGIRLIRDPCYARFQLKRLERVEIRLITTHIVFGKPKNIATDIELDAGAVGMRNNEFDILAGKIYPKISEYYKYERANTPYTIILGDYNMNLVGSSLGIAKLPQVVMFDKTGKRVSEGEKCFCEINTIQAELSTLKQDSTGLANNYDHFSFDNRTRDAIITRSGVVDWDNDKKYGSFFKKHGSDTPGIDKYSIYKENVSDHLPVVIDIDI